MSHWSQTSPWDTQTRPLGPAYHSPADIWRSHSSPLQVSCGVNTQVLPSRPRAHRFQSFSFKGVAPTALFKGDPNTEPTCGLPSATSFQPLSLVLAARGHFCSADSQSRAVSAARTQYRHVATPPPHSLARSWRPWGKSLWMSFCDPWDLSDPCFIADLCPTLPILCRLQT